uniref:ESPL1_1 protein n=1 Tax=Fopius arisanus TaxID=64838 RepID=A0A0C9QDY0_9HYME
MNRNASAQVKQWVADIQMNEFAKVQGEIDNYEFENESSKAKYLLRLLIYLCQTVTKVSLKNRQCGYEISNLSEYICKSLCSIPNTSNYFSSLYHIIRVLLEIGLYGEAMTICNYLLPPSTWHQKMLDEGGNLNEHYTKLWSMLYVSIDKLMRSMKPGSLTPTIFHEILEIIEYQLNIEQLAKSDGSKSLLLKLLLYSDFLEHLKCSREHFDEFTDKFFLKYLSKTKLHLGDRNRSATYENFTKIISKLSVYYIKKNKLETLRKILKKILKNFEMCTLESREASKCHQLLADFSNIFIIPLTNLSTIDIEEINDLIQRIQGMILSYGEESLIKSNIYAISSILETLCMLWGELGQNSSDQPPREVILSTTDLLNYLSEIIRTYQVHSLCKCGTKTCLVLQDQATSSQVKSRILSVLCRLCPKSQLPPGFFEQFSIISTQCVDLLYDLQRKNCEGWKSNWLSTAVSIYNFALNFSSCHYEKSAELYKFLASSIIKLKATDEDKKFCLSISTPPLSLALHRLSNLYYGNRQYEEARIYAALNVYFHPTHPDCQGYRNWSFIHYQNSSYRHLTLVNFLREHPDDLRVLGLGKIELKNQVLQDICIREIKSHIAMKLDLSEAILAVFDCLETLNADEITYATAVHQISYHSLNFQSKTPSSDHLKTAMGKLKSLKHDKSNIHYIQYLMAHFALYEVLEEIRSIEEATKVEMKVANIKLYAASNNGVSTKESNVVPTFSQINIKTAKSIASQLESIYNLWNKSLTPELITKWDSIGGTSTVKAIIVAGEYSRFYRYRKLEIKFWKMGYHCAVKTDSHESIVYITARSISSRYINDDWIENSQEIIASKLINSKEPKVPAIIAMFKLSLSDYYYYIGNTKKADQLYEEGMRAAPLNISENCGTFIFSQQIVLTHQFHNFPPERKNNLEYTGIFGHILYAMLLIDDTAAELKDLVWSLYEMDMVFEVSCNIANRMNALFSYREVTAHLVRRLKVCQPKISVLRVAEILKYLCIIDLSRNQLEDCEVKLQGMEHILQMETFSGFMEREVMKIPDSSSFLNAFPDRALMDPIRDIPQNDSSPILRRERFALPDFMSHGQKCKCFTCVDDAYKFLVFSCTHIRAQLYTLQNLRHYARQHFEGALNISEKLLDLSRKEDNYQYYYIIDYVLFLLDFIRFLKKDNSTYEEGRKFVCWALEICDIYKLECHPVYMSAMEIVFEYRFEKVFPEELPTSSLVIPKVDDIDVHEFTDHQEIPEAFCVTPIKESGNSPRPDSRSPRRKNKAPILSLSEANVGTVESDPEELSPPLVVPDKRKKRVVTRVKPVRRKLAENDFEQDDDVVKISTRKSSPVPKCDDLGVKFTTLINKAIRVASDLSRKLHVLSRKAEGPITDDLLQKLVDILEEGLTRYEKQRKNEVEGASGGSRKALRGTEIFYLDVGEVQGIIETAKSMMSIGDLSSTAAGPGELSKSRPSGPTEKSSRKGTDPSVAALAKGIGKLSVRSSVSQVDAVSKRVRKLSVRSSGSKVEPANGVDRLSVKNSRRRAPGIRINDEEGVGSDDEVVEPSIIEPRRSRRLVGMSSTTETKLSRKRL